MNDQLQAARETFARELSALRNEVRQTALRRLNEELRELDARVGPPHAEETAIVRKARAAYVDRERRIALVVAGHGGDIDEQDMIVESMRRLRTVEPAAWELLQRSADLEDAAKRLAAEITSGEGVQCEPYDGASIDAVILPRSERYLGLRIAMIDDKGGSDRRVVVIDDPTWSEDFQYVHFTASRAGLFRAELTDVSGTVPFDYDPLPDAIDEERRLDRALAMAIRERNRFDRWFENGITDAVVSVLCSKSGDARDFSYELHGLFVEARLHIWQQRGAAESAYGDISLIVEGTLPSGPFVGTASLEAKKCDLRKPRLLRALRKEQAKEILDNSPCARLLIYDLYAPEGWHAWTMPLESYPQLLGAPATADGKVTNLSRQLFRRYLLNEDLERSSEAITGAIERGARYVAHFAVGARWDRELAHEARRELPLKYVALIERQRGLQALHDSRRHINRDGPSRGRGQSLGR